MARKEAENAQFAAEPKTGTLEEKLDAASTAAEHAEAVARILKDDSCVPESLWGSRMAYKVASPYIPELLNPNRFR